jgi:hypothetical protein
MSFNSMAIAAAIWKNFGVALRDEGFHSQGYPEAPQGWEIFSAPPLTATSTWMQKR